MNKQMHPRPPRIILSLFLAVLAVAPAAGQQELPRIPRPPVVMGPLPELPSVEASTIEVPLSFSFREAFEQIEGLVPREAGDAANWLVEGGVGIKYRLWRDPVSFNFKENHLSVYSRGFFWVKRARGFSSPRPISRLIRLFTENCGTEEHPLGVSSVMETVFTLDKSWGLSPKTELKLCQENVCRLTFNRRMAADVASQPFYAGMIRAQGAIDSRISGISLRPRAEEAWRALRQPLSLEGRQSWLSFNPEGVFAGPLSGRDHSITTTLTILAQPRIETNRPPDASNPLPDLADAPLAGRGFHLLIEGRLPFEDASNDIEDKLVGQQYRAAGKTFQVTAVELSGRGEKALLKVRMAGDLSGTIYFEGRIAREGNNLSIKELRLSDATARVLADESAAWVAESALLNDLHKAMVWNLTSLLADSAAEFGAGRRQTINGLGTFEFSSQSQRSLQVFGRDEAIVIRFVTDGQATLSLEPAGGSNR